VSVALGRTSFDLAGGRFHALVGGSGRPVLYLHGFPDHPPTARPFLEELARERQVIAPWLRGYAPSPLAGPYDIVTLTSDVAALIEQVGVPADVVGHDWGAVIGYALCATRPALVRRAVALAVPHPATMLRTLRSSPAQRRRSWYMALFQLPGAGWLARANDFALIDRLWRTWSPGFELGAADRAELHACLAASLPGPIGYYRALTRPVRGLRDRTRWLTRTIAAPLLQLHGELDGCIQATSPMIDQRRFTARVHEVVPNAGHFLQHEYPHALAARVTGWLS
jgi:pimeloyl-ACP methyl ester carboxylesterase